LPAVRTLALLALLALVGCDDDQGGKAPSSPSRRADALPAGSQKEGGEPKAPASATAAKSPKPPRELCEGQTTRSKPPALPEAGRAMAGENLARPSYGKGWVWINVWAAWCEPCKEEMPRLLKWRDELRSEGIELELVFVSIDDDEREIVRQLGGSTGMRSSLWLADEDVREPFFAALGFGDTPTLPVHAFVSPDEKVTCVVEGAVEEADRPRVGAIFAKR
jgi:thiol-disulfide isomerase/thioredoxin